MELLAASILLCTILYLVDKNHLWGNFWNIVKWLAQAAVGIIAYAFLERYHLGYLAAIGGGVWLIFSLMYHGVMSGKYD